MEIHKSKQICIQKNIANTDLISSINDADIENPIHQNVISNFKDTEFSKTFKPILFFNFGNLNLRKAIILSFFLFFLLVFVSASDEGIVTINLNSSISWWNESILAYGKAEYSNGTPIQNTEVKIFVEKEIVCPSTNSTGDWSCIFTAPKEIKKYQIFVEV
ncbi:MAG: hypothetical protein QW303_08625, partial [Nitrososphaerota archaeon]